MDLERLTKHQVVLLTLLVSFVTSIATGIVTVSLMEQAPVGVTRTINQIVEHTVEKVVPQSVGASVATSERTVVVKDDDLTAQSIATVQKAMVQIVPRDRNNFLTNAVVVNQNGTALADRTSLVPYRTNRFDAILPNGERVVAVLNQGDGSIATLILALGTSSGITPTTVGDPQALKLGQSVIRVGGQGGDSIGVGIIGRLPSSPAKDGTAILQATVDATTPGSVLVTLFGDVVGISTGNSSTQGSDYYTTPGAPLVSPPAP